MIQSKLESMVETALNVGSGLLIAALIVQPLVFPIFDIETTTTDNILIAIIYSAWPSFQGHFISEKLRIKYPPEYQQMFSYLKTKGEAKIIANFAFSPITVACLAICAASLLCGSPAPEKIGSFWPLTNVFIPSITLIPV